MKLILKKSQPEIDDVHTFIFEPETPLTWQAGQYFQYHLPHQSADERGEKRWFTIASAPYEDFVQVSTRLNHEHSSTFKDQLTALKPGDSIDVTGPEGDFTVDDPGRQLVFIAGGIGITPFRSILRDLHHEHKSLHVTLFYANRNDQFAFREDFDALMPEQPDLHIHYIVSPEQIDAALIHEHVPAIDDAIFFVSGPESMVDAFKPLLESIGVPSENIKQDWFPGYVWTSEGLK